MPTKAQLVETVVELREELRRRGHQLSRLNAELAAARSELARHAPSRVCRSVAPGSGAPVFVRLLRDRLRAEVPQRRTRHA